MHLSPHSLRQLDQAYLDALDEAAWRELSVKLPEALKDARDRLNQGPENRSRPPSSRAPWERQSGGRELDEDPEDGELEPEPAEAKSVEAKPVETKAVEAKSAEAKYYDISLQAVAAQSFTLRAAPKGVQSGDPCGTLTLTNTGVKNVSGGSYTKDQCW